MTTATIKKAESAQFSIDPELEEQEFFAAYESTGADASDQFDFVQRVRQDLSSIDRGLDSYLCERFEALNKILQEEGPLYGPKLSITPEEVLKVFPFLPHVMWPYINLDYKGGVMLNWASAVATVSLHLTVGKTWSMSILTWPRKINSEDLISIDRNLFKDQTVQDSLWELLKELIEITVRSVVAVPDWKSVMRSQIDM